MFTKTIFYDFSKLSDKFKETDFQKTVKKTVISLEESQYEIFGKKVIKSFLLDCAFNNF